jgi:hypothetical protein
MDSIPMVVLQGTFNTYWHVFKKTDIVALAQSANIASTAESLKNSYYYC